MRNKRYHWKGNFTRSPTFIDILTLLRSSLSDLEVFRNELSDTIAELNASYSQLASVEESHLRDITTLRGEMTAAAHCSAEREADQLKEIEGLKRRCCAAEDAQQELQSLVQTLQSSQQSAMESTELHTLRESLAAAALEKNTLQARYEALEAKQVELVSTFRQQLVDLQSEARAIYTDKTRLQSELAASSETSNALNEQLKARTASLEKAKKAYRLLVAEKERLCSELSTTQSSYNSQADELALVKSQLEESGRRSAEQDNSLKEAENLHSKKMTQLSESLKFASDDLCATTNELSSSQLLVAELRQEVEQWKKQCTLVEDQKKLEGDQFRQDISRYSDLFAIIGAVLIVCYSDWKMSCLRLKAILLL